MEEWPSSVRDKNGETDWRKKRNPSRLRFRRGSDLERDPITFNWIRLYRLRGRVLTGSGSSVVRFISSMANAALTSISFAERMSVLYTRS